MSSPILAAALEYQALGWPVFPVNGKLPATPHGFKDATLDPDQARQWWGPGSRLGVALATGRPCGVWVLDVDGPQGEASLARLEEKHGPLPATVEALTGKGRHLYFTMPGTGDVRNSASQVAPGIDVRGTGGYVVLPPSPHPSGRRYQWREGREPGRAPVADPGAWTAPAPPPPPTWEPPRGPSTDRLRRYVERAIEAECLEVARSPEGQRNDRLNAAAFSLGRFVARGEVDPRTVARALALAATQAGLPRKEIERTLHSGLQAGGNRHG
jgi:hypothetical protein